MEFKGIVHCKYLWKIALTKHFLMRISSEIEGFSWIFVFSVEISSKIASRDLRIFYAWDF